METHTDITRKFIFEEADIRGETISLQQTCTDIFANHQYAPSVERLLGEFVTATVLLSTTIKFSGILTLQARSEGEVPLIMAECTSDQKVRAIARGAEQARSADFHTLLSNGQLAITITPEEGQAYQSVVPLTGDDLASCLEAYFVQSEQLATRIWLASDPKACGGLLLQQLPIQIDDNHQHRQESWEHACQLAATVTAEELLELDSEALLFRLYHQDKVRLFEPVPVEFQCSCSWERSATALSALPREELDQMLAENDNISIHCEFCNHHYHFDREAITKLFKEHNTPPLH